MQQPNFYFWFGFLTGVAATFVGGFVTLIIMAKLAY